MNNQELATELERLASYIRNNADDLGRVDVEIKSHDFHGLEQTPERFNAHAGMADSRYKCDPNTGWVNWTLGEDGESNIEITAWHENKFEIKASVVAVSEDENIVLVPVDVEQDQQEDSAMDVEEPDGITPHEREEMQNAGIDPASVLQAEPVPHPDRD